MLNTENNFYELQTAKCTKTLYQTDTNLPIEHNTPPYNIV